MFIIKWLEKLIFKNPEDDGWKYVRIIPKEEQSWKERITCKIFGGEIIYYEKSARVTIIGQEKKPMTAFEFLKYIKECGYYLPMSTEKPCTEASNAEIKRWLKSSSVIINSKKPNVNDEIEFPITELVFFPKGKRRTTMV